MGALKPHLEALIGVKDSITEQNKKLAQVPMNKLFIIDKDGNYVLSGIVETDNGIILKAS